MNNNLGNNINKSSKYKVVLCRHFETPKGCVYKDKCQFAHGVTELSIYQGGGMPQLQTQNNFPNFPQMTSQIQGDQGKKVPNPQNYKIVLCKNFEKEGTCKYESFCTFAHGDGELRTKVDNSLLTQQIPFNPQFIYQQMIPQDYQLINNFQMMPQQNLYDINQLYAFQGISPQNLNMFGNEMINIPNDNINNMHFPPQNMSNLNNNLNPNNLNFYQQNIRNNNIQN